MTEISEGAGARGPSHRGIEIAVAIVGILFALIVIAGSLRVGVGWASDGPRAGFFPFYVALMILGSSIINLIRAIMIRSEDRLFAEWGQLWRVASVVIPTAIYVAVVPVIGIYVSSMVLIAFFMKWLGRYSVGLVLLIAIGVPVLIFVVFEKWFLVPLPKGPIEELLGL